MEGESDESTDKGDLTCALCKMSWKQELRLGNMEVVSI